MMEYVDFHSVEAKDLTKHLDKRLKTVLQDFMDRCAECGVSYEDATVNAIMLLGHYFACATHGMEATENDAVTICKLYYAKTVEKLG
jgi:hypothetical protein